MINIYEYEQVGIQEEEKHIFLFYFISIRSFSVALLTFYVFFLLFLSFDVALLNSKIRCTHYTDSHCKIGLLLVSCSQYVCYRLCRRFILVVCICVIRCEYLFRFTVNYCYYIFATTNNVFSSILLVLSLLTYTRLTMAFYSTSRNTNTHIRYRKSRQHFCCCRR